MNGVYVQPTNRRIEPFGDPASEVLIAHEPLSVWLDRAIAEAGFQRLDAPKPPCLVVPDTLFTTGPILARFVADAAGRDAVLGVRDAIFADRTNALQPGVDKVEGGWRFDAVRFVSPAEAEPEIVWVDVEEQVIDLDLPDPFRDPGDDAPKFSLPRHPVMTIHHWLHLLWANQAAGASTARRTPVWKTVLKVIWAILRTLSLNKWKILGRLNTIGKGCDIHPTAVVEGSTLGDGVEVGPFARVLFSNIGDGAKILPGAHVEMSTVGERATVAQKTAMRLCLLYPDAFHGQGMMQASILGHGTLTTLSSFFIDLNFERNVRVMFDGELRDTGTRFAGAAIGHRCRVGTGVWMAPGRAVPNDTVWMRDPDEVVRRVPRVSGPGPMINRGGSLEPLRNSSDRDTE